MPGNYLQSASSLSGDWAVSAFVSATLDWLFSMMETRSHILNTISALAQLTTASCLIQETVYSLGLRRGTDTIQSSWIVPITIYMMSPNAFRKLQNSYYAFHKFIYGTRSITTPPDDDESSSEDEDTKKIGVVDQSGNVRSRNNKY